MSRRNASHNGIKKYEARVIGVAGSPHLELMKHTRPLCFAYRQELKMSDPIPDKRMIGDYIRIAIAAIISISLSGWLPLLC